MNFEVKIIEDSISPAGKRLTTITATYPRFIHSEIMTHRDRARNAASSRAIPWPKMREAIVTEPVVPIRWGMEQSGMQTGNEIPERMRPFAESIWREAMMDAVYHANRLASIGAYFVEECQLDALPGDEQIKIHKSLPNRIVEPWMWITVVMTATEWKNFFRLRCHPDAEVHFQKIACMIRDAMAESKPVERTWHLPFIQEDERGHEDIRELAKISTARCARVSYLTHEGIRSQEKDLELFDRLSQGSGFGHWSPHEHPAHASWDPWYRSGPFVGWCQWRKDFGHGKENEPG